MESGVVNNKEEASAQVTATATLVQFLLPRHTPNGRRKRGEV
jgi:hypothetical protein